MWCLGGRRNDQSVLVNEEIMGIEDRGFASMDRTKQREIARKGGRAAHLRGTAHEWSSEEAREAGRKGGRASHRKHQQEAARESVAKEQRLETTNANTLQHQDWRFDF
jgi:general stress protein YciG